VPNLTTLVPREQSASCLVRLSVVPGNYTSMRFAINFRVVGDSN